MAVSLFFMVSCSNEGGEIVSQSLDPQLHVDCNCKTLQQLQEYNNEIVPNVVTTRSIWGWLKKVFKVTIADVGGALQEISDNSTQITALNMIDPVVGTAAIVYHGINGGVAASKNAWNACTGLIMTTPAWNQLSANVVDFCIENEVLNDLKFLQSSFYQTDTIFSQISLPFSKRYLKTIGLYHNEILNPQILPGPLHPNGRDLQEPFIQNPLIEDLLESEDFTAAFFEVRDTISQYCNSTDGFNVLSYMATNPFSSTNVNNTFDLFIDAIDISVIEPSDLIDLVNDYVSIIEANNDFSDEEKTEIYAGFVVSVYSYSLWYSKMQTIIFE